MLLCALGIAVYLPLTRRNPLELALRPWPWLTLIVAAAVASAWYVPAFVKTHGAVAGVQLMQENFGHFVPARLGGTGEASRPFYYLLVRFIGTSLPFSLYVPALLVALMPPRKVSHPQLYQLGLLIAVLGFFSIASAKRDDYILPAFPPFAIVLAAMLAAGAGKIRGPGGALARSGRARRGCRDAGDGRRRAVTERAGRVGGSFERPYAIKRRGLPGPFCRGSVAVASDGPDAGARGCIRRFADRVAARPARHRRGDGRGGRHGRGQSVDRNHSAGIGGPPQLQELRHPHADGDRRSSRSTPRTVRITRFPITMARQSSHWPCLPPGGADSSPRYVLLLDSWLKDKQWAGSRRRKSWLRAHHWMGAGCVLLKIDTIGLNHPSRITRR